MKIKFNWGFGIVVFVGIFMIFILSLVYKCTQQKIDLVAENYYDRELHFQDQINRVQNSNGLTSKVNIIQSTNDVLIQFPDTFNQSKISGTVEFYKPDDAKSDFQLPINVGNELNQRIATDKLAHGKWQLKVSYSYANNNYFAGQDLFVGKK